MLEKNSAQDEKDPKEYQEYLEYLDYLKYIKNLKSPSTHSGAEAAVQGFGQFAGLGMMPALQTGAGKLMGLADPNADVNEELRQKGFKINEPEQWTPTYQEMQKRDEALQSEKPGAYYGGGILGAVASSPIYSAGLAKIGLGAKPIVAEGFLQGAKQGAIQAAKQGAVLGAASMPKLEEDESWYGPSQIGKRLVGSAFGAGAGGLLGGLAGGLVGKYGQKVEQAAKDIKPTGEPPAAPANELPVQEGVGELETFAQKKATEALPAKSFEELTQINKDLESAGKAAGRPSLERVNQIEKDNPDLLKKIPGFHDKALSGNKADQDVMRTLAEVPGKIGEEIRKYEASMRQDAQKKVFETVAKIGKRPPVTPAQSGAELLDQVATKHEAVKQELAPLFESFKNVRAAREKYLPILKESLVKSIPELEGYLSLDKSGNLNLAPYRMRSGISPEAHKVMSGLVDELNSGGASFQDLQRIREALRQQPYNMPGIGTITKARKAILDYMEGLINSYKPGKDVVGTFKKYAINEKNLDQFQRIVGGKIENFDELLTVSPEKVLNRIFSEGKTIRTAKEIVGEDAFKNIASDWVNNIIESITDQAKGTMSSQRLYSVLKKQSAIFKEALDPKTYKRLTDLADYMRLMPDTPSVNPSGTAKTGEIISQLAGGKIIGAGKEALGLLKQSRAQTKAIEDLNKIMSGKGAPGLRGASGDTYKNTMSGAGLLGSQAGRGMLK